MATFGTCLSVTRAIEAVLKSGILHIVNNIKVIRRGNKKSPHINFSFFVVSIYQNLCIIKKKFQTRMDLCRCPSVQTM